MTDKGSKSERARLAAQISRRASGYIPRDAQFVREISRVNVDSETSEIVSVEEAVDRSKLDELLQILEPLQLDERRQSELLARTQAAVEELSLAPPDDRPNDIAKRLSQFSKAAGEMARAWAALGHDAQGALLCHLEGRGPTARGGVPTEVLIRFVERSNRFRQVASDDIWAVGHGASELAKTLGENRAHNPAQNLFCLRVCVCWRECVGENPTISRAENDDGERYVTVFEEFIKAASPINIGDRIIRAAVADFKNSNDGDKTSA